MRDSNQSPTDGSYDGLLTKAIKNFQGVSEEWTCAVELELVRASGATEVAKLSSIARGKIPVEPPSLRRRQATKRVVGLVKFIGLLYFYFCPIFPSSKKSFKRSYYSSKFSTT